MQSSAAFCVALVAFFGLSPTSALPANVDPRNVISRDVAIIGGGSSGIHAAIQLKDAGKSIMVIESKARIGGHTDTWTDPKTGIAVDYGVSIWHNISSVLEYFNRFNVPLAPSSVTVGQTLNIDFTTGAVIPVPASSQPTQEALAAAFQKYAAFLMKYPQLASGMFLPNPVPKELSQPFGQLVQQLGIEAIVPILARLNPGNGDLATIPVVEFARVAGLDLIKQTTANSFLTTARHNNSEIYGKAQAELLHANSLLLSSHVISSQRKDNKVELAVQTPEGIKYICAKKVVIAIPPRLENLQPFSPTEAERSVFSRWINAGYYTCIVNNTGLPTMLVDNINPNNPFFALPSQPGTLMATPNGVPGLFNVYYVSPRGNAEYPFTLDEVKSRMVADLKRAQTVNQKTANFTQTNPEFVVCAAHQPFYLQVSSEDIDAGFYNRMNALQGQKSFFYTGAAFRAHDSSMIWDYNNQVLLPMLLKSLGG
ncbi:hypothetical protein BM1_06369 [Bipolaris maydis]|nr:hypothetical protein BM1_06369 [Bipolaris maydis]KAJ6287151.1 hypothetical protein J3E71DRAFT_3090 [Bipolaris maydis]